MGSFDYAQRFPSSPNLKRFGEEKKEVTVDELAEKWLGLKQMEISSNTFGRYQSAINCSVPILGGKNWFHLFCRRMCFFFGKNCLPATMFFARIRKNR